MKRIKKLVAVTGTYQKDGQEKKQYATCGSLFQREDGSFCVKLDTVPVNFDGWLNAYDLDENRQKNAQQGVAQAKAVVENGSFEDGDIPF